MHYANMQDIIIHKFNISRDNNSYACGFGISENSTALEWSSIMSETEAACMSNYSLAKKQNHLLGRYIGKKMLGSFYEEADLSKIIIKPGVFGQPIVSYQWLLNEPMAISISHSNNFTVAVSFPSHHIMGIDIEDVYESNENHIVSQLTEHEKTLFDKSEGINSYYTRLWTIKEALSKAIFTGLTVPFSFFEIQNIIYFRNYTISIFTNFLQYKAISFNFRSSILTLVLPKKSNLCPYEFMEILGIEG
jgi:4'-phosphopantetheinyl transferase